MNLPLRSRCLATLVAVAALFRWAVPLHAEDEAKLHDELRQLRTVYENAINSGDLTPLAGLFSPGSSGVVVNNQTFTSLAELKAIYEKFRGSFPGVVYRIKMDAAPSQIYGDIAVAHGTCEESVKLPVGDFAYTSNWTVVLRRVGGQWTLIRSQVTMDPFGSSIVDYLIRQTKLWFGLGGAVGGLVIGFFAARAFPSRKRAAA